MMPTIDTLFPDLIEKDPETGCWLWKGYVGNHGYGHVWHDGKWQLAHRVSWELANNKTFPAGLDTCHSCDVRRCVSPAHIRAGTRQDNVDDMLARHGHPNALKTHCRKGHPYTEENTYRTPDGRRDCRICINERSLRRNRRNGRKPRVFRRHRELA